MAVPQDRVAVLVIRVWVEPDSPAPALRVRMTVTPDIVDRDAPQRELTSSEIEEVCDEVRRFLLDFSDRTQDAQAFRSPD